MTPFEIELKVVSEGYDRKTCWVHARPAVIPGEHPGGLVTAQKLRITGDDVFYEINHFCSDDGGETWSRPFPNPETLGRKPLGDGTEEAIVDFTPSWHEKTGVILGTGINAIYREERQLPYPPTRATLYSVYDPRERRWSPRKRVRFPNGPFPFLEGAGCAQRFDLPNGDILLPTYFRPPGNAGEGVRFSAAVMRCRFDGETVEFAECGPELSLPCGRGFVEPSLAFCGGRYYLTLRNDEAGYVASSEDGLRFGPPRRWTFDDGRDLGSYNTQQHWVMGGGELYLVYTRRGAGNDHIMRHRAPLFIARVDRDRLCVVRESERILIPEHGARLGNFGVATVSDRESWVAVAEWMQTTLPDPFDCTVCEAYGSNNRVFLAKIRFS